MRLRAVDKDVVIEALQILQDWYSKSGVGSYKKTHVGKAIGALKKFNGELTGQWVDDNIQGPETQKKVKSIISLGYLPRNENMAKSEFNQVRQASHSSVFCLASYTTRK